MSWQGETCIYICPVRSRTDCYRPKSSTAYVDTNLVGTGKIERAAILGRQGGVWATSKGYNVRLISHSSCWSNVLDVVEQITPEEQKTILASFDDIVHTEANGITLAGKKFFTLQATNEHVYGKKSVRNLRIYWGAYSRILPYVSY